MTALVVHPNGSRRRHIHNGFGAVSTGMIMTGTVAPPRATMRIDLFALATLSFGAAAIHFAVIGEHFAEYALFGVFFSVVGWFEALWALAYVVHPTQRLAGAAFVVNVATVLIWGWAHLVGLPFGPDPGQVEPTTITDLMATLFEIVLVGGLVIVLTRQPPSVVPSAWRAAFLAALIVAVALGTTLALAQPPSMGG
ncbi:MAG: hypothetical protein H0V73_12055 [Chloroflexi bacterium]|nr:hypothetical protein [Chloroflexota bacterium]